MHFELKEEYEQYRKKIRAIVEEKIAPYAEEIDATGEYPTKQLAELTKIGMNGYTVPKEYGGAEKSMMEQVLAAEELARGCMSTAAVVSIWFLGPTPLVIGGNEEQKRKYLPLLASGECIASFGLTEPHAGSDAASIKTEAKEDGDGYVLNGQKYLIGNGGESNLYFVFAKTDPDKGAKGVSCFLVEKGTPGFTIGPNIWKVGLNGQRTAELFFDNCRIPKSHLIGNLGEGFKIAMQAVDPARVIVAATSIGMAQAALEEAVKFAKERIQFGEPIAAKQGIMFKIADMRTQLQAARLLTYRAAEMLDHGGLDRKQVSAECAMAKYYASEICNKIAYEAVQIHGGRGLLKGYKVERIFRDARASTIYEGTSEVQKILIGRYALNEQYD